MKPNAFSATPALAAVLTTSYAVLRKLAIPIAARHWSRSYELDAHYNAAARASLGAGIIDVIGDGRGPEGMAQDEAIIHDFSTEPPHHNSVSDRTYARAVSALTVHLAGTSC